MTRPIRAVLFDVDGTLYRQAPVRVLMAAEMAVCAVSGRAHVGGRVVRALSTVRTVREELRQLGCPAASLSELQFDRAADRIDESPAFMRQVVEEWMFQRPIKYLRLARRTDVASLVLRLKERGIALGVLSDYPADAKLRRLGLSRFFRVVLCTTEDEINAFNPHPRGFHHACQRLGFDPSEVAYVGDRVDVDAAGARAAGMRCYLVGHPSLEHARDDDDDDKEGSDGIRRFQDLERICLSIA